LYIVHYPNSGVHVCELQNPMLQSLTCWKSMCIGDIDGNNIARIQARTRKLPLSISAMFKCSVSKARVTSSPRKSSPTDDRALDNTKKRVTELSSELAFREQENVKHIARILKLVDQLCITNR